MGNEPGAVSERSGEDFWELRGVGINWMNSAVLKVEDEVEGILCHY